jgi:hypothetical protein
MSYFFYELKNLAFIGSDAPGYHINSSHTNILSEGGAFTFRSIVETAGPHRMTEYETTIKKDLKKPQKGVFTA